jgi:hypothetical protein
MSTILTKRIEREILYIRENMPSYEILEINYNVNTYNLNINTDTYIKIITPNGNKLVFILQKDYPFKVPKNVEINDIDYMYPIKNMPKRIDYLYYHPNDAYYQETSKLEFYPKSNCLCCSSLLCAANWSPACTIYYIINEINNHNNIKRHIMYKLLLKEIVDIRNLPLDLIRLIYDFL